jgi:DNA-binding response OmpR family regulator
VAGEKIMIVDDDENLLKALTMRLRAADYKVVVAQDGMQAVMVAHKQDPDLILLDIRMPAGDGFSVMDKLALSIKTQHIPVIIVTAFDDDYTMSRVQSFRPYAYFRKPVPTEDLLETIKTALSERAGER